MNIRMPWGQGNTWEIVSYDYVIKCQIISKSYIIKFGLWLIIIEAI